MRWRYGWSVYSTCIFCHAPLGANESIEHFPVGRRLAFDAAKGRLWVVCRACERWNLTPLEERWEAIEECERLFRDTKLRVSTDNVGLAKLREGTTLVRIGDPQRPEMAAWRYGDQFGRRRRKYIVRTAAVAAGVAGVVVAGPIAGLFNVGAINLINLPNLLWSFRTVARVNVDGERRRLHRQNLAGVVLRADAAHEWELVVPFSRAVGERLRHAWRDNPFGRESWWRFSPTEYAVMHGDAAKDALRQLLPRINATGGSARTVAEAVGLLDDGRSPEQVFLAAARAPRGARYDLLVDPGHTLKGVPVAQRLALEMVLHETDERRALDGELAELEARWREAEEVAAISDDMFLPERIRAALKRMSTGNDNR